jgi:hypothetical protein
MKGNETDKKQEIPLSFHESLDFKDICPVWSFKLKSGFDEQDVKTLVHDSKYCIVGEAWKTGRILYSSFNSNCRMLGMCKIRKRNGQSC